MTRTKANKIVIMFSAAALLFAVLISKTVEAQDVSMYHYPTANDDSSVIPAEKWAAWIWSERLGIDIQHQGSSTVSCVQADATITGRTTSVAGWAGLGKPASVGAVTGTCTGAPFPYDGLGFLTVYKPGITIDNTLASHETGHALGAWAHRIDPYDLMHSGSLKRSVGIDDINMVIGGDHFNLSYSPSYCFVEWLENGDLFAPDFEGKQVYMDYLGVISGNHQWQINYSVPNSSVGCDTDYQSAGWIYLFDIRAPDANYDTVSYWGTLQPIGGQKFKLVAGGTN